MRMNKTLLTGMVLSAVSSLAFGCADDDTATSTAAATGSSALTVLLEPEGTITDGIEPGDAVDNIRDGWKVEFSKYIVAVGDVDINLSTNSAASAEDANIYVIDIKALPAAGEPLWFFDGLAEGRWDFNYATPGAADGSTRHESVTEADYDAMVASDWTYLINGSITKEDGQSCPPASLATPGDKTSNGNTDKGDNPCFDAPTVNFEFGVSAETSFGPCEIDGVPGAALTNDQTQTVAATIHGDHIFFNGFPEGDEGGVLRLAQWIADCDLDLDGTVTIAELEQIAPSDLAELDDRYQLGGSPITPLTNMYEFVVGQLKTQGHYQGEGECPYDGVAHDHGHGHDGDDHADEDDHADGDDHSDEG